MEIGRQIRNLRQQKELSQDDLALKIYVTRQTISNWENDKNYPDVKSLLLLSSLFNISLDQLIKGDVEEMKEIINSEEMKVFKKDSVILTTLFIIIIVVFVPLVIFVEIIGIIILGFIAAIMLYYAYRVERNKKKYNIQTYKEIVNFLNSKELDDNEIQQELGKRVYQKILLTIGMTIAVISFVLGIYYLFERFL